MKFSMIFVVALVVVALGGCGDDESPTASTSPAASEGAEANPEESGSDQESPLPPVEGARAIGSDGRLKAGLYFTDRFRPQAVFTVNGGWDTRFHGSTSLELRYTPEPRDEVIYFDGERADMSVGAAIENVRSLFEESTGTKSDFLFSPAGPVTPKSLNAKAFRMDVRTERPVSVVLSERNPYQVRPGDRLIVNAVDTENGTVVIFVEAPGDAFDQFLPTAERVLNTLRFP